MPSANRNGTLLDAVTKDQLHVGLTGQIRFRVSEQNLYAYLFAVKNPPAHVMGFFISILRERIANFEQPPRALPPGDDSEGRELVLAGDRGGSSAISGISINDLRKNSRACGKASSPSTTSSSTSREKTSRIERMMRSASS